MGRRGAAEQSFSRILAYSIDLAVACRRYGREGFEQAILLQDLTIRLPNRHAQIYAMMRVCLFFNHLSVP